jgi:hypothetical protein
MDDVEFGLMMSMERILLYLVLRPVRYSPINCGRRWESHASAVVVPRKSFFARDERMWSRGGHKDHIY